MGEDQAQHLELTREVASAFHHTYSEVFPLPITLLCKCSHVSGFGDHQTDLTLAPAKRVMSLSDPSQKMSKSALDPKSRILLTDNSSEVQQKIKRAVTDSVNGITYDPRKRPGVSNLIEIYAHMQGREDFEHVANEFEGLAMKSFKERVAECVNETLEEVRKRYTRISEGEGDGFLEKVVREGSLKAAESAEETMVDVRKALGLL